jgi:UDPglucose 6-dehydrogenase
MKFGILGYGFVGKATHKSLIKDANCIIYDIASSNDKNIILDADTVFICIPTNTKEDIDIVINEIKFLKENSNPTVIIRSTLPLGSCTRIQQEVGSIIYMPELKRPLIVGRDGADALPNWLQQEEIHECSTSEAELVKMFSNNYAVMRIAFANVFYDLANNVGADYNVVKDMFFKIEPDQTYMEVPGHDGTRGFGGKCLPKDLDFLIDTLDAHNINQNWFKHIRELNTGWKEKF